MSDTSRSQVVAVVEQYLRGLGRRDLSSVPFSAHVTIESPLTERLTGVGPVVDFLRGLLPAVKDVRIKRHIVDGDFDAVEFELDTVFGVIPVFDCVRVRDGRIEEIRPYYDPRPITEGVIR